MYYGFHEIVDQQYLDYKKAQCEEIPRTPISNIYLLWNRTRSVQKDGDLGNQRRMWLLGKGLLTREEIVYLIG